MKRTLVLSVLLLAAHAGAATTDGGDSPSALGVSVVTDASVNSGDANDNQDQYRENIAISAVSSNGPATGAKCTLSNDKGVWSVVAPGIVSVKRSAKELAIHCEMASYAPADAAIEPTTIDIPRKHFTFGTDAGGAGDTDDSIVTVPQYWAAIEVHFSASAQSSK